MSGHYIKCWTLLITYVERAQNTKIFLTEDTRVCVQAKTHTLARTDVRVLDTSLELVKRSTVLWGIT